MRNFIALLISVFSLALAFTCWQVIEFISSDAGGENRPVIFEIAPGSTFNETTERLKQAGLIRDAFKFKIYAKVLNRTTRIRVGEYSLNQRMTPRQILRVLSEGKSVDYALTIPEGYNMFEIADMLNQKWPGRGDEFLSLATNPQFVQKLLGTPEASLEGYLFPETYSVTKYTKMETLIRNMYAKFESAYKAALENAPLKLSRQEHVILASMIEKETGAPEERPMIASVFHNRLAKHMRLQSDPTIIYGIWTVTKKEKRNITRADLLAPTPYNTYTVNALPAGPIANPGIEALKAAVNPVVSENLYFVSRNDGTHVFTKTYEDHRKAVGSFQLDPKAREGKSWRDLKKKAADKAPAAKNPKR